jgi:hypothetical protein
VVRTRDLPRGSSQYLSHREFYFALYGASSSGSSNLSKSITNLPDARPLPSARGDWGRVRNLSERPRRHDNRAGVRHRRACRIQGLIDASIHNMLVG